MGGLSIENSVTQSHSRTHKTFLISCYFLMLVASVCIFLTLSLRLIPSLCGFFLILLHVITIAGAVSGCSVAATSRSNRCYAAHMVVMVLTSIFQGSASVLILTRTSDFLGYLKSYVEEDDGAVILKVVGGLCVAVFCLEWAVLGLGFVLRYYAFVEVHGVPGNGCRSSYQRNGKVEDEDLKNWPWPFQV